MTPTEGKEVQTMEAGMFRNVRMAMRRGQRDGYEAAYRDGFAAGKQAGAAGFAERFPGTSIIIPTYNKKNYLIRCIESVRKHTDVPYELIVVDNASNDGTAQYLRSQAGAIRFHVNERNLGFAGAVNQGLMMAKGTSLLLLNNDTVVTPRWLSNLLACLHHSPGVGMVGPLSNYVSGKQLLRKSYRTLAEMQRFADRHNRSDARRWERTERLIGFCLLMRREVFESVGYLDEGYELGNYEDDDYSLRALLCGWELAIARDTFIHHYGNVSMKSLGRTRRKVTVQNRKFYFDKWGDRQWLLNAGAAAKAKSSFDFYPSHIAVAGPDNRLYWIAGGVRRPIEPLAGIRPVRVSRYDLLRWPVADALAPEHLSSQLSLFSTARDEAGSPVEGNLYRTPDGRIFQWNGGKWRRFASEWALRAWGMEHRPIHPLGAEQTNEYSEGLPIIAPPVLRAINL
jgi:GT2 family glycosyltransferase